MGNYEKNHNFIQSIDFNEIEPVLLRNLSLVREIRYLLLQALISDLEPIVLRHVGRFETLGEVHQGRDTALVGMAQPLLPQATRQVLAVGTFHSALSCPFIT